MVSTSDQTGGKGDPMPQRRKYCWKLGPRGFPSPALLTDPADSALNHPNELQPWHRHHIVSLQGDL